jgi:hypothetical protein
MIRPGSGSCRRETTTASDMRAATRDTRRTKMSAKTIDEPTARRGPSIRWSGREWKLFLTTVVSAVYTAAWVAFAIRSPRSEAIATRTPQAAARSARTVWLTELPASERPSISLPPGWVLAAPSARPRPAVVRRSAADHRIRTRSS